MGKAGLQGTSAIKWCNESLSFWLGCTQISPGCDHCYAKTQEHDRFRRALWGNHPRVRTQVATWHRAYRLNVDAARDEFRLIVFANPLADFFDNQVPTTWRDEAWEIIKDTTWLDWILLTKRPQNIARMLPQDWHEGYDNVWLGVSVESQPYADQRIPPLLQVPAKLHMLSLEPLLGSLDLRPWLPKIGWCIVGGEHSRQGERYMEPDWARDIRDQCAEAGCPFLMKQMTGGESVPIPDDLRIEDYPQ